jgi:hypothetical protein
VLTGNTSQYSNDVHGDDFIMKVMTLMMKRIAELLMIPMVVLCSLNSDGNYGGNDHGDGVVVM